MISIYDESTNALLGSVTEEQFRFLEAHLEEEGLQDTDYYINTDTVAMLQTQGADPALIAILLRAIGSAGEADIRWVRDNPT